MDDVAHDGGPAIARKQLEYLLGLCERPGITVRVVPFKAQGYIGSPMLYMGGPVPQLDTVQVDAPHSASFLDAQAHLKKYRVIFNTVETAALSSQESRDVIHAVAQEL